MTKYAVAQRAIQSSAAIIGNRTNNTQHICTLINCAQWSFV